MQELRFMRERMSEEDSRARYGHFKRKGLPSGLCRRHDEMHRLRNVRDHVPRLRYQSRKGRKIKKSDYQSLSGV